MESLDSLLGGLKTYRQLSSRVAAGQRTVLDRWRLADAQRAISRGIHQVLPINADQLASLIEDSDRDLTASRNAYQRICSLCKDDEERCTVERWMEEQQATHDELLGRVNQGGDSPQEDMSQGEPSSTFAADSNGTDSASGPEGSDQPTELSKGSQEQAGRDDRAPSGNHKTHTNWHQERPDWPERHPSSDLEDVKSTRSAEDRAGPSSRGPSEDCAGPSGLDKENPGKACIQCGSTVTPMWRNGPNSVDREKRLCNACGVRQSRANKKRKSPAGPKTPRKKRATERDAHDKTTTTTTRTHSKSLPENAKEDRFTQGPKRRSPRLQAACQYAACCRQNSNNCTHRGKLLDEFLLVCQDCLANAVKDGFVCACSTCYQEDEQRRRQRQEEVRREEQEVEERQRSNAVDNLFGNQLPDAEMDANVDALLQDLDPGPSEPNPGQHLDPIPDPHQGQGQDPPEAMQPDLDVHNNPDIIMCRSGGTFS